MFILLLSINSLSINNIFMNEVVKKISSYNIFNYLFPWVLFVLITDNFLWYKLIQDDLILWVFLYYFIWLIISRLWSLIIEPLMRRYNIIKFADYKKYIKAEKKDTKIIYLLEVANMYRSLVSLFIFIILTIVYKFILLNCSFLSENNDFVILIILLILFIFSYKKQVEYIRKRVSN